MAVKRKVLVVDDEPSVCEGIELVLAPAGFEVKKALTGEDAIKSIEREDFDVVLMDLIMPGMDGTEACERIKAMKPYTRVVAISGSPSGQRLERFLRAGGIELYLYKPFGKQELIDGIEKALKGDYIRFREDT